MTEASVSDALARLTELAERLKAKGSIDFSEILAELPDEDLVVEVPSRPSLYPAPAVIRAATSDTFLIDEVKAAPRDRQALLANSDAVVVDGQHRLRLLDDVRAELLHRLADDAAYHQILSEQIARDESEADQVRQDPVRLASMWLRRFLRQPQALVGLRAERDLRAAAAALDSLSALDREDLPSRLDVELSLQLSELLEPLRILIGATGGWAGEPYQDRFVGRERDLRFFRAFVDGLASRGAIEHIQRGFVRTRRRFARRSSQVELLLIEGRGGLGKSSLIAKFVLQHALGQVEGHERFPFAYIDFDRATVEAREPQQLLLEVMRQIGLQFEAVRPTMEALRERVRAELQGRPSQSSDLYHDFRWAMADFLRGGATPFLLVLDTFEAAQYDAACVAGVDRFLTDLIGQDFPGLRIVISGRAGLTEDMQFVDRTTAYEQRPLEPLSVTEARAMADALGRCHLADDWKPAWGVKIAGRIFEEDPQRREPLSVRVAVDTLCSVHRDGRDAFADEIAAKGEGSDDSFVGRLYQKRILDHVQDTNARRLAWPGLVVRNVTEALVRDVLCGVCGVPQQDAKAAFEALARHTWIVDRRPGPAGDVLRHRKDLRSRTLPLMRKHDPVLFAAVNRAALDYFALLSRDPQARAEWLYHRLMSQEPACAIDQDWTPDVAAHLADAADDFPQASEAHLYLLAKAQARPAPRAKVQKMPTWIAFEYLANVRRAYGDFDDRALQASLLDLAERDEAPLRSAAAETSRRVLLIKTGRWSSAPPAVSAANPGWLGHTLFARWYLRARLGASKNTQGSLEDESFDVEPRDVRPLTQMLASAVREGLPEQSSIDAALAAALQDPDLASQRLSQAMLRVTALFGRRSFAPAARHWAAARMASSRMIVASAAELKLLAASSALSLLGGREAQVIFMFADRASKRSGDPQRFADLALSDALRALMDLLRLSVSDALEQTVRDYMAFSREDWITPLAYAAARALRRVDPQKLRLIIDRVETYDAPLGSFRLGEPVSDARRWAQRDPIDAVALLRRADEASDCAGLARLMLDIAPPSEASRDLEMILEAETHWTRDLRNRVRPGAAEDTDVYGENPPRPGPILTASDPQKGRWGGRAQREGRRLRAELTDATSESVFVMHLVVESTDGSDLRGPVVFHLHPTFPRSVIHVRKVRGDNTAGLFDVVSYGAFTAGVQVRRADGRWIGLELDLTEVEGLPKRFLDR